MMLRSSGVGRRKSGLAVLGVSTIVLAAAGEAMWHANEAGAMGVERPAITGVTIGQGTEGALEEIRESRSMTEPDFMPFVLVRIPLPEGYSSGEVLAVNDAGQAVGWMHYDTDDRDHAFFFDAASPTTANQGVTILDLDTQQHDATWAHSITNDSPPVIAGAVMWKGQPNYLRACVWSDPTEELDVPFASGVVSTIYDVNEVTSTTTYAGMYVPSSTPNSVVYDGSFEYPASGVEGEARGMNGSGEVVGWHTVSSASHAYSWVSDATSDIHPSGWDESGANCINANGDVAGWAIDAPNGAVPAFWDADPQGFYTFSPFVSIGAASEVRGINSHGEMAITNTTSAGGGALWQVISSADVAYNFNSITLMPDSTGLIFSANAINDDLWVGGSYKATSQSDPQPCLIIPYDVDNDGEPDYREIVNGIEADLNENWLIDSAESIDTGSGYEGMRVGLHTPRAANGADGAIESVQIVRLGVNVGPHGVSRAELIEDEDWIEDILNPTSGCECRDFYDAVTAWGTGEGRTNSNFTSEILVRVHSMMAAATFEDYETLPDPASPEDREEALADLKDFAYRFARCIDYFQWGNESFGGAREYIFRGDEFGSGCDFTTAPKTFSQLSDTCKAEALDLILAWQREQMWAALEGSALGGRPLRMSSAGVFAGSVRSGYDANNVGRYLVTEVSEWCNDNQVYFSLHNHYMTVSNATDAITKLVDTYQGVGAPWDVPNWRISTEVGARADFTDDWWSDNEDANLKEFARYFLTGDGDPVDSYEDFVNGWLTDAQGQWDGNGAELDVVFDTYAAAGFAAACWSARQWQTGSDWETLSPFLIEGLIGNQVRSASFFEQTNTARYTPLKTAYEDEDAAAKYNISNFVPHGEGCDVEDVCPECN